MARLTTKLGAWPAGVLVGALATTARAVGVAPAPDPPAARRGPSDPGPSEPEGPTAIFVVVAADTDPRLLEAVDAARVHLLGEGVALAAVELHPGEHAAARAHELVGAAGARGVFWFDERRPDEIRVFLLGSDGSAFVRRVPIEASSAEASREAVWIIVESGSMALATGQTLAMEEASVDELAAELATSGAATSEREASAPAPAPVPAPAPTAVEPAPAVPEPPPARPRGDLTVGYLGEGVARAIPWQSGVGIGGGLELGRRWRLALDYGLLLPWRAGDPVVTWRHRGELRAGPRWALGSRVQLYALVGGGVEAVRWRPTTGNAAGWRAIATAGLDAGLELVVVAPLALVLEPGGGVVLNRFDFIECAEAADPCAGASRRVVLGPWRVRPRVRAGLRLQF